MVQQPTLFYQTQHHLYTIHLYKDQTRSSSEWQHFASNSPPSIGGPLETIIGNVSQKHGLSITRHTPASGPGKFVGIDSQHDHRLEHQNDRRLSLKRFEQPHGIDQDAGQ